MLKNLFKVIELEARFQDVCWFRMTRLQYYDMLSRLVEKHKERK